MYLNLVTKLIIVQNLFVALSTMNHVWKIFIMSSLFSQSDEPNRLYKRE